MTELALLWKLGPWVAILLLIGWCIHLGDLRAKWEAQAHGLTAKLEAISTAKNEQKQETAERIKVVTRTIHDADSKAKEVEQQPIAEQCHGVTPSGVRNADV